MADPLAFPAIGDVVCTKDGFCGEVTGIDPVPELFTKERVTITHPDRTTITVARDELDHKTWAKQTHFRFNECTRAFGAFDREHISACLHPPKKQRCEAGEEMVAETPPGGTLDAPGGGKQGFVWPPLDVGMNDAKLGVSAYELGARMARTEALRGQHVALWETAEMVPSSVVIVDIRANDLNESAGALRMLCDNQGVAGVLSVDANLYRCIKDVSKNPRALGLNYMIKECCDSAKRRQVRHETAPGGTLDAPGGGK